MNIFVGNLLFETREPDVKKLFEEFGSVLTVSIVMEKNGTKSRGFGFVEMPDNQEAKNAITALNGREFMGRIINVSPAFEKTEADKARKEKKQLRLKLKAEARALAKARKQEDDPRKATWFDPVFVKEGGYKGGRRSRSYIKKIREGKVEPQFKNRSSPIDKTHKLYRASPDNFRGQGLLGGKKPPEPAAAFKKNSFSKSAPKGKPRGRHWAGGSAKRNTSGFNNRNKPSHSNR